MASHGRVADALVSAARMIVGTVGDVHALDLAGDESPESFAARLRTVTRGGDGGRDVRPALVLTDLRGGSPHNLASTLLSDDVRVVGGANLAMVLEAVTANEPLTDVLVERVVAAGRDGIVATPRALAAMRHVTGRAAGGATRAPR